MHSGRVYAQLHLQSLTLLSREIARIDTVIRAYKRMGLYPDVSAPPPPPTHPTYKRMGL